MAFTTIAKPSDHFDCPKWDGSDSTTTITGMGFKPDALWIRRYDGSGHPVLNNSSEGTGQNWLPSGNNANNTTVHVASYTSDGFTLTGNLANTNDASDRYVGACWKANGATTSSNSDGSITSTVQVNSVAKFSIVTYTGTGSNATIGHGLGVAPKFIIVKRLNDAAQWQTGHFSKTTNANPETDYIQIDGSGSADNSDRWNDTLPTTSVVSLGTNVVVNGSGSTYVAYCFAENKGFSAMGAYSGITDNADGPMIYTGFRPSMILIKRTDGNESWQVADIARGKIEKDGTEGTRGNTTEYKLLLENAAAENSNSGDLDIYSTGFKLRDTDGIHNWTDYKYVYIAFSQASIVGTNGTIALAY